MDLSKVNLRGPSTIVLEGFVCEVCGKRRSTGDRKNKHIKCSKIRQQKYRPEALKK